MIPRSPWALAKHPHDGAARQFLEFHVDSGMAGKKGAEQVGQKFGGRCRVGEAVDAASQPAGIFAKLAAHPLDLAGDRLRVPQQRPAGRGRMHAGPRPLQ